MKNDKMKNQYRVNEQIRVKEVRIVGDGGSEVVPTRQALDMARQQGVDLVEISPNANPPVCRLIDYSKFLYQQKKHQKEIKAKQVKVEVKEIRFGPQTDDHDYNFKLNTRRNFWRTATRFAPMCSSAVAQFCSRSKEKFCCCASPTTSRNTPRWSNCRGLRAKKCSSSSRRRRQAWRRKVSRSATTSVVRRKPRPLPTSKPRKTPLPTDCSPMQRAAKSC